MRQYHQANTTTPQRLRALICKCDGTPITPADVLTIAYTIQDMDAGRKSVPGHTSVLLDRDTAIKTEILTDPETDLTYNFEHVLDITEAPAFPKEANCYRLNLLVIDRQRIPSVCCLYYRT